MKKTIISLVMLSFTLTMPMFASASIDANLYYGIHNKPEVQELQEFLIDKGFLTGSATGNFYSLTLGAVKKYQSSVAINSTGYVGTLTRKSINDELVASLTDSNKDSTDETGTVPPTPEPQKTANDVVSSIQSQMALLQKQLDAVNAQQTTLNQIAQNTTPTTATPAPIVSTPAPVALPDLGVSCSATLQPIVITYSDGTAPTTIPVNQSVKVNWVANPTGGDGNYKYFWTGIGSGDGLVSCNYTSHADGTFDIPDYCFNNYKSISAVTNSINSYADANGAVNNIMKLFVESNNQIKNSKCSVSLNQ